MKDRTSHVVRSNFHAGRFRAPAAAQPAFRCRVFCLPLSMQAPRWLSLGSMMYVSPASSRGKVKKMPEATTK